MKNIYLAIAASLILAACGGGGSSASSTGAGGNADTGGSTNTFIAYVTSLIGSSSDSAEPAAVESVSTSTPDAEEPSPI